MQKKSRIVDVCDNIWKKRISAGIWIDNEYEKQTAENLVYKRLDGLRAILIPLKLRKAKFSDLHIPLQDFIEEINSLASYLSDEKVYFFPSPHLYFTNPLKENFIDMAANSMSFAINSVCVFQNESQINIATLRALIKKSFECLTDPTHVFYNNDKKCIAWGATTITKSPNDESELRSAYFSAQAIMALCDWLGYVGSFKTEYSESVISNVKDMVNKGCRWILQQKRTDQSEAKGLLATNLSPEKIAATSRDELITVNAEALKACLKYDNLGLVEKQEIQTIADNYVKFLLDYTPQNIQWNHMVLTSLINSFIFYPDRQDNYGIISFLSLYDYKKSNLDVSELVLSFVKEYIDQDVSKLLIGCLPWYVEDLIAFEEKFDHLNAELVIKGSTLNKAISAAFKDEQLTNIIYNAIYNRLIEQEQEIKVDKYLNPADNSSNKLRNKKLGKR